MNEKIKALAEQFKMNFSVNGYPQDGLHWDNVDEFAELIVRECVLEAMDAIHHDTSIRLQVYKHFGIEL